MKHLLLTLTFCAGALASATPAQVLGRWITAKPVATVNGINFYLGMNFTTVTTALMSTICEFPNGKRLEPMVNITVAMTDTKIQTVTGGHNEVKDASGNCNVDVSPGSFDYQILGGASLHLLSNGQVLELIQRP
jgi:hypothetical protein